MGEPPEATVSFNLLIAAAPAPRLAIAADVRAHGKYLGQITEAVVETSLGVPA